MIKPIIKWVGGKTQILSNLYQHFPTEINNYFEPFTGGGSVFMELLNRLEQNQITLNGTMHLNDKNHDLINMYVMIQTQINLLIEKLKELKDIYFEAPVIKYKPRFNYQIDLYKPIEDYIPLGKSYVFYYYRDLYNSIKITGDSQLPDKINKAALFIFLNKTSFRGVYREGPNGYNVPFGNHDEPSIFKEDELKNMNQIFNKYKIKFTSSDFNYHCLNIKPGDFIYLDPPYYPINETSFVGYKIDGFSDEDHKNLAGLCHHLNTKNIKFLQSNSYCDYNIKEYQQYNQEKISCKRRINPKKPGATANEILVWN